MARIEKETEKPVKPFKRETCWQSGSMFIFRQSALTHCASAQPLSFVWCVRSTQACLSLRSTLIPVEHVCWNSPPIKTGISQVRCGNQPSVGKQRVCPSLLPSFSLALVHHANSLPSFSPPYCNSSSSIFTPYILSVLCILVSDL